MVPFLIGTIVFFALSVIYLTSVLPSPPQSPSSLPRSLVVGRIELHGNHFHALGVAIPFVSVAGKPLVASLPNRHVFFLHIIASFLANEQYHRKQEIATEKNGMFAE